MMNMNVFDVAGLVNRLIRERGKKFTIGSFYGNSGLLIVTALGTTSCSKAKRLIDEARAARNAARDAEAAEALREARAEEEIMVTAITPFNAASFIANRTIIIDDVNSNIVIRSAGDTRYVVEDANTIRVITDHRGDGNVASASRQFLIELEGDELAGFSTAGDITGARQFTPSATTPNLFFARNDALTDFDEGNRGGAFDVIDARHFGATTVNLDTNEVGGTDNAGLAAFEGYYGGIGIDTITLDRDSANYVNGGGGDDTFNISGGEDHSLTGGSGADTFNFMGASDGTTITDFETGVDELVFSGLTNASYAIANGAITILHGADGARENFTITAVNATAGDIMGATLLNFEQFSRQALADGAISIAETNGNLVFRFDNGDIITFDRQAGAYNADTNSDGDISLDEFIDAISDGTITADEVFGSISGDLSVDSEVILDFNRALDNGSISIVETSGNLVLSANGVIITFDRQAGAYNADTDGVAGISADEFFAAIDNLDFA